MNYHLRNYGRILNQSPKKKIGFYQDDLAVFFFFVLIFVTANSPQKQATLPPPEIGATKT